MKIKLPGVSRKSALVVVLSLISVIAGGIGYVLYSGSLLALMALVPFLAPVEQDHGVDGAAPDNAPHGELRLENVAEAETTDHENSSGDDGHGGGEAKKQNDAQGTPLILPPNIYYVPEAVSSEFTKATRRLLQAQTAIALGNLNGGQAQKEALIELGIIGKGLQPERLRRTEILAVGTYLLSGGQPDVARRLLESGKLSGMEADLLHGIYSYTTGDLAKARPELGKFRPRDFPPALGGRIALALAQLADEAALGERMDYLHYAANILPGTLVEEAALRRLIHVASLSHNDAVFFRALERYLRRFPRSLYSADFKGVVRDGILRFETAKKPLVRQRLDKFLPALGEQPAQELLLELALSAVRSGFQDLCLYASGRGLTLTRTKNPRLVLYNAACRAVAEAGYSAGMLAGLDPEMLSPEDREIWTAARNLTSAIQVSMPAVPLATISTASAKVDDPALQELTASVAQQSTTTSKVLRRMDINGPGERSGN